MKLSAFKFGSSASKKSGFTLVELLVVIAIIAILSVTAYVALGGQTAKARNSRRQQDLAAVQSALEIYFVENFSKYPSQLEDDGVNNNGPELAPKYMQKIPKDPHGESYAYAVGANNKSFQLAATLEQDDGTYKAYVIGNSSSDLIDGAPQPCSSAPNCLVTDNLDQCLAYCPN